MSKAVTLSDLKEALAPLLEAINKLKEEQTSNFTQVSELYQMVSNLSTKADLAEQQASSPVATKPAKRAPAKRGAKKTDDIEEKKTVKKLPAKRGVKKVEVEEEAPTEEDAPAEDEEAPAEDEEAPAEEEEDAPAEEKKKTVKKVVAKGPPAKKGAKKTKPAAEPKQKNINKMQYFGMMFDADESYFDEFITPEVKNAIYKQNKAKWDDLGEEELKKAKKVEYYNYMKTEHDSDLVSMKTTYQEENNTNKAKLVEKDSD